MSTKPLAEGPNPPAWAEAVLRTVLAAAHRDSVSGDLLEEYRDRHGAASRAAADSWYLRQAAGFVWRATWWWGALLASTVIVRTALDWFVPPATFETRSAITTLTAVGLFSAAGFWTAWRTRSLGAGLLAGIAMSVISAALDLTASLVMLGIWHDPATLQAIERSGGLGEVFGLPILVLVPGSCLAALGGAAGMAAASLVRPRAFD